MNIEFETVLTLSVFMQTCFNLCLLHKLNCCKITIGIDREEKHIATPQATQPVEKEVKQEVREVKKDREDIRVDTSVTYRAIPGSMAYSLYEILDTFGGPLRKMSLSDIAQKRIELGYTKPGRKLNNEKNSVSSCIYLETKSCGQNGEKLFPYIRRDGRGMIRLIK